MDAALAPSVYAKGILITALWEILVPNYDSVEYLALKLLISFKYIS